MRWLPELWEVIEERLPFVVKTRSQQRATIQQVLSAGKARGRQEQIEQFAAMLAGSGLADAYERWAEQQQKEARRRAESPIRLVR